MTPATDTISYAVLDLNGDGLEELYAYVETNNVAGYQLADREVFTLAPAADADGRTGSYTLTMNDVVDLPHAPPTNFEVGAIEAGSPTTYLIIGDKLGSDMIIRATALSGDDKNHNGLEVNSANGTVGIENEEMNAGSPQESMRLDFGTGTNASFVPQLLNDVTLNVFNIGPKTDTYVWDAIRGDERASDTLDAAARTVTMDSSTGEFTTAMHWDGGYDSLVVTTETGNFKIAGFSFQVEGAPQGVDLNVAFGVTDHDGDTISGSLNVALLPGDGGPDANSAIQILLQQQNA
ncbi:MAG: hypothetical protein HYX46_13150 [Betaproteobacteria bacterium]|nr:hypothetical protein [Betaproteobacteria bacterium]